MNRMDIASASTTAVSDVELLTGLRAGAPDAYRRLVEAHGGRMLSVARRIVDEDDARDSVQDAFVQVFRKLDTFQGNSTLATWLHRIVVNAALMRRRTRKRHAEVSLADLMPVFDGAGCRIEPTYTELHTPDLADQIEVQTAVIDALAKLPEEAREIIVMRDVQGLDTQQTADELGISLSATKVRLHRARAALKQILEPVFGAPPSLTTGDQT